jgi:hypothetical protein
MDSRQWVQHVWIYYPIEAYNFLIFKGASSVYAPAITQISDQFGVGQEVGTLGVTFLLMGFGTNKWYYLLIFSLLILFGKGWALWYGRHCPRFMAERLLYAYLATLFAELY